MTKHIFVTGGVASCLGKETTAANLAWQRKQRGLKVAMQKLDPYLNVDSGTMSPFQYSEVFVTEDGTETDLNIGHYERFADITCSKNSNYTSGKIYSNVISREHTGDYLGGTMRLGFYPCSSQESTTSYTQYGELNINERLRHRYEVNPVIRKQLADADLVITGTNPDDKLVEIVEVKEHPYFVDCQFNPEFKSRPREPHPLFLGLIKAAQNYEEDK